MLFVLLLMAAPDRAEINARALELGLPVFWRADDNGNGVPEAAELVATWPATAVPAGAVAQLLAGAKQPAGEPEEIARQQLVRSELRQAQSALVSTQLGALQEWEKTFITRMLSVAAKVDQLYSKQIGSLELESELDAEAPASRSLFFRNHGPWCVMPATEKAPLCNALASRPQKLSALYPSALQKQDGFCETLLKHRYARALAHPFAVVRGEGDTLKSVPYHIVFSSEMDAVAAALKDAAAALPEDEAAMKAYLLAARQAFVDNQWAVADEAWVKTGSSRFYARVAPDETYADPCARKAMFAMILGRTNAASVEWRNKLEPQKQTMEAQLATLAGAPYKLRHVNFALPDFIDVIVAAGDARLPFGATIGQSLPIFGKVAAEGRRRTSAMTNLFVDKDSTAIARKQAESVFCRTALAAWTDDAQPKLATTIFHEAAHNLGPAGFYQVDGKSLPQIFGPQNSLILNELHAQSAALFFTDWLTQQGVLDAAFAASAHLKDLMFALDQIARGLTTAEGKPKPYGALSAVQLAALLKAQALVWRGADKAANMSDTGCLAIDADKLPAAITALNTVVLHIRAQGDKTGADALLADALSDKAPHAAVFRVVSERFQRFPKVSFVYGSERR